MLGMCDTLGSISMVGGTLSWSDRCGRQRPWEKLDWALKF